MYFSQPQGRESTESLNPVLIEYTSLHPGSIEYRISQPWVDRIYNTSLNPGSRDYRISQPWVDRIYFFLNPGSREYRIQNPEILVQKSGAKYWACIHRATRNY